MEGVSIQKQFVSDKPWVLLLGDFNVKLHVLEHSAGGSSITKDMQEL